MKKLEQGFIFTGAIFGLAGILGLLSSITLLSLNSARIKSRDAKRIADIAQFSAALNLYYNDHNSYPTNLEQLKPKYFSIIPVAPTPPDGPCTEAMNTYSYKILNQTNYQIKFCLGLETGSYGAGERILTKNGIDQIIPY